MKGPLANQVGRPPPRPLPPPTGGWTRHLRYFIYPRSGNGVWRWNVGELLKRWDLFNGSRRVAVATGPGADTLADVRDAFAGRDVDLVEVPNHPFAGEAVAFKHLWGSSTEPVPGAAADYRGAGDVTFYGHAKGVKYDDPTATRTWTGILYAANLDFWPLVEREFLLRKVTVGSLRQSGPEGGWIYAGTFYWFRNVATFGRDWDRCRRRYAAVELWPGKVFPLRASGCLFKDYPMGLQAYDRDWIAATAAEFAAWGEAHAEFRRRPA